MKKIFGIIAIFIVFATLDFAGVIDTPGPHTFWNGDTLKKDSTKTAADFLYTSKYRTINIWVKATNPADSTKFRVYYRTAFNMADVLATPGDTTGTESDATLIQVSDTLWHYRSLKVAPQYNILYLKALTGHGNRCRVWLKVYLSPD